MQLNLHAGGVEVDYATLASIPLPEATATHLPIAHSAVVDMAKFALQFFGHEVVEEHHAIDHDGLRYFGVLTLKSQYGDYTDVCGLRNSNDRKFPIGIAFGSAVFVCSNLAFFGDHVIRRKHTPNAKRDLPGLVAQVIEPLKELRLNQMLKYKRYRSIPVPDELADQAIMQMYRREIINLTRIPDVIQAFENPPHDWGEQTAWRLFNAATFALTGRVAENPRATQELHSVIDGVCEVMNN